MTASVHRRYLGRWIAITIAATAMIALLLRSMEGSFRLWSVLGVLFAGAVDGCVFAVLARTLRRRPDRFLSVWLWSLVVKFLALGGGCILASVAAQGHARGFLIATALSFAAFVISDAAGLAALGDRAGRSVRHAESAG